MVRENYSQIINPITMIHSFLGITKIPHPDDERIAMLEPVISFFGDQTICDKWIKKFDKDQKQFIKVDWLEPDAEKRRNQINIHFKQYIQWFADNEFHPAGEASGERIYYSFK